MDNAKLFIDFLTSKEGQQLLAMNSSGANPIRTDIDFPAFKEIMKTANIFPVDSVWSAGVKKSVQERFINLLMDIVK
jgi:ABC-type Fe3+ transport system substrate-binding protein